MNCLFQRIKRLYHSIYYKWWKFQIYLEHNKAERKSNKLKKEMQNKECFIVINRIFGYDRILSVYFSNEFKIALKQFREEYHCFCDDGGHHLIYVSPGKENIIIASTEIEYNLDVLYPLTDQE
jgi:hypothetical protein